MVDFGCSDVMAAEGRVLIKGEKKVLEGVRWARYRIGPVRVCVLEPILSGFYFNMRTFDIRDGREIATTGKAEERSSRIHGVTHGYDPRVLLCYDRVSVPGEFRRLKAWMSPRSGQQDGLLMDFQL